VDPGVDRRARIEDHWAASERGDTGAEHEIYAVDAILDYPQSGERFGSRSIMEFARGFVVHETQYVADPFPAAPWRAALAEPVPGKTSSRAGS
jgi:hypothetical protein